MWLREKNDTLQAERASKLYGREWVRSRNRYRLSLNGLPSWQAAHRPIKTRYHTYIKISSYENRWSGELRSRPSGLRIYEVVCFLLVQMESPSLDLLDPVKGMCTEVVARLQACSYRSMLPPSSKMVSTFFSTTGIFTTLQVSWILLKAILILTRSRTSLWNAS